MRGMQQQRMKFVAGLLCLCVVSWCSGCQNVQNSGAGFKGLSKPRLQPDGSILEILSIEIDVSHSDDLERLWREIDDQAIELSQRQTLDLNGFRAGVASSQLPAIVHELMHASQKNPLTGLPYKQIQNRAGQTFDLDLSSVRETLDWRVANLNGSQRVGSCQNAVCALGLTTFPHGDRSIRLNVTPKFRYGNPRNRYTVEQDQFLLRPLLDETQLAELSFDCRLCVGQTLIVGPTQPPLGVGQQFFYIADPPRVQLLLIRLIHSQPDDLFGPQAAALRASASH